MDTEQQTRHLSNLLPVMPKLPAPGPVRQAEEDPPGRGLVRT